jgi:hypothetical protein
MKVVGSNGFGSSAKLGPRHWVVTAVGRALKDLYADFLNEPLPGHLVAAARRIDGQSGIPG